MMACSGGLLAGCRGPQSALDPAGPAAEAIAQSWWLMFWGASAVWVVVLVLLLLALRGRGREPLRRPYRLIVVGGLLLPTVALAALLVHGSLGSARVTGRGAAVDAVIEVTARQWQWEFRYLDREGQLIAATIDELVMPLGRMVEFRITSQDVIHSFWVPRLGGKIDAIPGRVNTLRLRADQMTPMRGQCAEYCGLDHAKMDFNVRVLAPAAHARWLAQAAPMESAQ